MLDITYGSRYANTNRTPLSSCPWVDAFTKRFDFDAHAWAYTAHGENGAPLDPQLRVASQGGRPDIEGLLLFNFVFLDYDSKDLSHDQIIERLAKLPQGHYLYRMAVLYFTKGGVRLVYRLDEPVLFEDFGPLVRGLAVDLWQLTGLQVDSSTDQWWRCFRLPLVNRADEKAKGPTWDEAYFQEPFFSPIAVIDPDEVPRRSEKLPWAKAASTTRVDAEMPDPDQDLHVARKRLYKVLLRSSRFRHYIFDDVEILPGRRDQTILAMAGEIVARAFTGVPETDPEELFLLLMPTVRNMPPDAVDKLWRLVMHSWTQETAKKEERSKKLEEDLTQRDRIVEKMLTFLPPEDVPNDPAARRSFASRHYCLQTGKGAYAVQKDGTYTTVSLNSGQLPAHFHDGLMCLDDEGFRNPVGHPYGGDTILNMHSVNIDGVEYSAGLKQETRLLKIGERRILQITPFSLRSDLIEQAEFDKEVDGWLNSFAEARRLKEWIASALALHQGGTAALYLHGPARVGKTMLAQGIAECFHAQPVPGAQAFAEFNGGLFESPVIMIDEGLPSRTNGVGIADQFRSMVTGSPISIQRKRMDAVTSKIPYRLIFAANSFDMVKQLIGTRTMAPQDREAFRERILVMDTGVAPANYLDSRGAMEFTRHSPKGAWLGGACRLARHFIRLYQLMFEEQVFQRDGRLLVEGRSHPAFTLSFDLSGAGRDVVDDLTRDVTKTALDKQLSPEIRKAMSIDQAGRVWLKKRPYTKYACSLIGMRNAEPYSIALDRFLKSATRTSPLDMALEQEVDLQKVIFCAKAEGLNTSELIALELKVSGIS